MSLYNLVDEKYKQFFQENGTASFDIAEIVDAQQWVEKEQLRFEDLNSNGMPRKAPNLMFFKGQQPQKSDIKVNPATSKQRKQIFQSIEEREAIKRKDIEEQKNAFGKNLTQEEKERAEAFQKMKYPHEMVNFNYNFKNKDGKLVKQQFIRPFGTILSYLAYRHQLRQFIPRLCKRGKTLLNFEHSQELVDFSEEKILGHWYAKTNRKFNVERYKVTPAMIKGRTFQNQFKNAKVEFVFNEKNFDLQLEVMLQQVPYSLNAHSITFMDNVSFNRFVKHCQDAYVQEFGNKASQSEYDINNGQGISPSNQKDFAEEAKSNAPILSVIKTVFRPMQIHFDYRTLHDLDNNYVNLEIKFDWSFYHKKKDSERKAFMQKVGGEGNLKFLLQVAGVTGSRETVEFPCQQISLFLKSFNLTDCVSQLFKEVNYRCYRPDRNVEKNRSILCQWLRSLVIDQSDPNKRLNVKKFRWVFEDHDDIMSQVFADEKICNVDQIRRIDFRSYMQKSVDDRFMKLANLHTLKMNIQDNELEHCRAFLRYLYQPGNKLKFLKMYNADSTSRDRSDSAKNAELDKKWQQIMDDVRPNGQILDLDVFKIETNYEYDTGPGHLINTLMDSIRAKRIHLKSAIDVMCHLDHTIFKPYPEGKGGIVYMSYSLREVMYRIEEDFYDDQEGFEEVKIELGHAIMKIAHNHKDFLEELWTDMPEYSSKSTIMDKQMMLSLADESHQRLRCLDLSYLNLQAGHIVKLESMLKRRQLIYLSLRANKIPTYELCDVAKWLFQGQSMRYLCMDGMEKTRGRGNSSQKTIEQEFQLMLEYLANVKSLTLCGITYSGQLFTGKAYKHFAEFLKNSPQLKTVYYDQNGYNCGQVAPDEQVRFVHTVNQRTTPLEEIRFRQGCEDVNAYIYKCYITYNERFQRDHKYLPSGVDRKLPCKINQLGDNRFFRQDCYPDSAMMIHDVPYIRE